MLGRIYRYDELSNDGGESAIRPAIVFAKHIEMSEICNNSACFSAEIKGTSDICVTFEFYNNPQKESSERGIVCYQTAGRRKRKKPSCSSPINTPIGSGGFDFQSRRFFAFAQTNDDLQGRGSRLEVILPCPSFYFAVSMICTS